MTGTFTLLGVDFNYLVMLSRFLDGLLVGLGLVTAIIFFALLVRCINRKPKRRKIRVKLIATDKER